LNHELINAVKEYTKKKPLIYRLWLLTNIFRFATLLGKSTLGGAQMQAYCMKCRTKREIKNAKAVTLKNKRPATQGVCPVCGTKLFRIGKG